MTGQNKIRFSVPMTMTAAIGILLYTLLFPIRAMENIRTSLGIFAFSVLPALAVFSVCIKILIKVGLIRVISSLPFPGFLRFFGISAGGFTAFLFGAFAGFPMGAVILSELCENGEITPEEAASLLPFCNQAGVSFVVGTVGTSLFGDVRYGWLLFFAQTSAAATGLLLTAFLRKRTAAISLRSRPIPSPFSAVTDAVSETAAAMVCVCGFIVFFSLCGEMLVSLCSVLPFDLPEGFPIAISGFLELSSGIVSLVSSSFSPLYRLVFCGFLLGFGGFCAFLQAVDRTERFFYAPSLYLLGKLLQTLLCPLFVLLFFSLL